MWPSLSSSSSGWRTSATWTSARCAATHAGSIGSNPAYRRRDAFIGVVGHRQHLMIAFAENRPVAMIEAQVSPLRRSASLRPTATGAGRLLHQPRAGRVVGVAVRIEHGEQL